MVGANTMLGVIFIFYWAINEGPVQNPWNFG